MKALAKAWKTSVTAIITMLFGTLRILGVIDVSQEVVNAVIIVAIFILGLLHTENKS
jgi:hypothetical protein